MGKYIEGPGLGKVQFLIETENAEIVEQRIAKEHIDHPNKAVIIVVNNGAFEAAAFAYSENEFNVFTNSSDMRPKTFLLMDRNRVNELIN